MEFPHLRDRFARHPGPRGPSGDEEGQFRGFAHRDHVDRAQKIVDPRNGVREPGRVGGDETARMEEGRSPSLGLFGAHDHGAHLGEPLGIGEPRVPPEHV